MAELWVIGNGFDLRHQLPTRYSDFYQFAKTMLDELKSYYAIELEEGGPWCNFENSLGNFIWNDFYDAHNHIDIAADDFRPSFVYGLEDELNEQADEIVEGIKDSFREWVEGINVSGAVSQLAVPEDALFTSFNYTSTLEVVYGIAADRVLHLHGRAELFDDLIFGHGDTIEEEPELDENGDSNRTMFSDAEGAAKYPFYALKKPVSEVLEKNKIFFDSLEHITEITVVGHSLNRVDLPYFQKLAVSALNAHWKVCCFGEEEKIHHVERLVECGVPRDRIRICSYEDLQI
ncbi:AbiH family protein [Vreelandella zhaodongensis]|uniref:Bacteriophage abortive infection AbiH family protein n=1 Tax=Vreelandella zhaodongensis TaxID=1176240 RepID=A0ABX2SUH8_VREZH|nr:bacteriophage abortive infection AbiH family protein [Halomonas zhaodongensis]